MTKLHPVLWVQFGTRDVHCYFAMKKGNDGIQVYFDRKEIEAWMKRNRHQTTDDVVRLKKYRIFVQNKTQTREIKGTFCYQFVTRTIFRWG